MFIINGIIIFLLTLFLGKIGLPYIRKLHLGQTVRDDGPKTHFKKSGTPTFGGLFFLIPFALTALILPLINRTFISYSVIMILTSLFGLVGFLDDYIKVRVDKGGLSVWQKTVGLTIVCSLFAAWFLWFSGFEPFLYIPFIKERILIVGGWKILYFVFIILFLFFMSNAVNITDGIDGLVSSLMPVTSLFLGVFLYLIEQDKTEVMPLLAACAALMGGPLGFLFYNRHPAKIFMGDTGSQALGACFAATSLLAGVPWIIILIGLIYILEAFSTLLQVFYFKVTKGKRLFRMAPLHHHFELGGWSEKKVVLNFNIFTVFCGVLSLLIFFYI